MLNIIKMDFYKLMKSKTLYVVQISLISLMLVLALFMRVSLSRDYETGKESSIGFNSEVSDKQTNSPDISEEEYYLIQNSIKDDLNVESIVSATYKSPVMLILLTIFMALFIGSELESGYIKNIVPLTNSRPSLVISKSIIATAFIIIQAIVLFLGSIIASYIITGKLEIANINPVLYYASLQMLLLVAFSSLLTLIGYLFKSTTLTVGIGILLSFNIIGRLLNIVDGLFNVLKGNLSKLVIVGNSVLDSFGANEYWRIIIVCAVYFVIYNIVTIIWVKKMEVK